MAVSKQAAYTLELNSLATTRWPVECKKVIKNPCNQQLREWAKRDEVTTKYGSPTYLTNIRSRSAANTFIVAEDLELGVSQQSWSVEEATQLKTQVHNYLKKRNVIQIDRVLGNSDRQMTIRLYVTEPYARIALMLKNMYFPPFMGQEDWPVEEIDLVTIYVPELNTQERKIFANVDERTTYITGTDYFGEAKKSFLRQAMYSAKEWGGLGLHAGSKVLRVRDKNDQLIERGFIMFGLSGTGKTTLTIHNHELCTEEKSIIRQDDVVLLMPDGYCYGTEAGFFIKTDGLDERQQLLYQAAKSPDTCFENVFIDSETGEVDFEDCCLSSNGRGVLMRKDVSGIEDKIDVDKAHNVIFITRRDDVVPALARLTPEQAAAYFMLGESIETGAGDPTKRGESKRCVGTNPFIIGSEAEEGNRFLEILRKNPDMQCYLLNTGRVGTSYQFGTTGKNITVEVSTGLMRDIARGTIKWKKDSYWGYDVAVWAESTDLDGYNPEDYFTQEQYQALNKKLKQERLDWLNQFNGLHNDIINTLV